MSSKPCMGIDPGKGGAVAVAEAAHKKPNIDFARIAEKAMGY